MNEGFDRRSSKGFRSKSADILVLLSLEFRLSNKLLDTVVVEVSAASVVDVEYYEECGDDQITRALTATHCELRAAEY